MTARIVEETLRKVKARIRNLDEIKVEQVVLGLGYTAVRLNSGHSGLCFTFQTEIAQATQHCQVSDLAGTLAGMSALKLAEYAKSWEIQRECRRLSHFERAVPDDY